MLFIWSQRLLSFPSFFFIIISRSLFDDLFFPYEWYVDLSGIKLTVYVNAKGTKNVSERFQQNHCAARGLRKICLFSEKKNINMTKVGRQINPYFCFLFWNSLKVINCKNPVTNAPVIYTFLVKFTTQSKLCKRFSRGKKALMPYSTKKFELNLWIGSFHA